MQTTSSPAIARPTVPTPAETAALVAELGAAVEASRRARGASAALASQTSIAATRQTRRRRAYLWAVRSDVAFTLGLTALLAVLGVAMRGWPW